jgi:hypothetical protein
VSHASPSGVLAKIERAKTHLNDFDTQVRPIIAACRNTIVRECNEQRSEYIFRFGEAPVVPPVLSAIIGDAVHNLRVSLDHLAWQLVLATGKTPGGDTSFPIFTTRLPGSGRSRLPTSGPVFPCDCGRFSMRYSRTTE